MELFLTMHFALGKPTPDLPLLQHQVIAIGYFRRFPRDDGRKELTAFEINPICATTIDGDAKVPDGNWSFGYKVISISTHRSASNPQPNEITELFR
ncbi:hypothetical protein ACLUTX_19305 [Enterobacterales bacterium AE_CKDN230030158-1A_HGKHYDSX7]